MQIKVIRTRNIWRNIWEVTFRVGNSLRHHRELFRPIKGVWHSGEAYPTGCKSSPLRAACSEISQALNLTLKP